MEFTEEKLNQIRKEMNEAIASIGKKHGFTGSIGAITYGNFGFHTTLKATVTETKEGKSGKQVEFESYARKFGYNPNSFGKTYEWDGKHFTIIGVNSKARKLPIIAKCDDGKEYKLEVSMVKLMKEVE